MIVEFEVDGAVPSAAVEVGKGVIFCVPKSRGNRGEVFHQFRSTSTQTAMAGMRKIQQVMMPKTILTQTYATLRCGWPGRLISITAPQISSPPITRHMRPVSAQTTTYILVIPRHRHTHNFACSIARSLARSNGLRRETWLFLSLGER
jgi:hypothetical protein